MSRAAATYDNTMLVHTLTPLALARRRAGLTQVQLAAKVGCCPNTIALAERGALSQAMARRCAAALGVPVESILAAERHGEVSAGDGNAAVRSNTEPAAAA